MIYTTIKHINQFMWGNFLIILLLGSGLFFTIKFKFIQIRKFKEGFKRVTSSATLNGEKAGNNGMSSFQALEIIKFQDYWLLFFQYPVFLPWASWEMLFSQIQ